MRTFHEWAASRQQLYPISALKDTTLGIEAAHYLDRLLNTPPSKEPLLSALGGFPFALKTHIEHELEAMQSFGIRPLFVFSGMEFAVKEKPMLALRQSSRPNAEAWELYNQHQAVQAVDTFGNTGESACIISIMLLVKARAEQDWSNRRLSSDFYRGYCGPIKWTFLLHRTVHGHRWVSSSYIENCADLGSSPTWSKALDSSSMPSWDLRSYFSLRWIRS